MGRGSRLTGVIAVVAALVVLAGCQWSAPRFDAGASGFNPFETTIGLGNVASLTLQETVHVPDRVPNPPVVAGSSLVLTSGPSVADPSVSVYPLFGACPPSPSCAPAPRWQSVETGTAFGAVIDGDLVYVPRQNDVLVYDLEGGQGCSGTPTRCSPIRTLEGGLAVTVAGDFVYVGGPVLRAYDRAAVEGCSGSPTVCQPRWTFSSANDSFGAFAVVGGTLVAGGSYFCFGDCAVGDVFGLDATGASCPGSPGVCQPQWRATFGGTDAIGAIPWVAISDGRAYAVDQLMTGLGSGRASRILAFDLASCAASVNQRCDPTWFAFASSTGPPTIGGGAVHVPTNGAIATFPVDPSPSCGGTMVCSPTRTTPTSVNGQSAALANGVLYADGRAFDAAGSTGCSGTPPVCHEVWNGVAVTQNNSFNYAAISGGRLVLSAEDAPPTFGTTFRVFALP